jgi:adenylate cyclase
VVPIGVGLHTGVAFVGNVGVEGTDSYDVTALGDAVNVTSRLASLGRTGEVLVSDDAYFAASLDVGDLERRTLELKGQSELLAVRVLTVATAQV